MTTARSVGGATEPALQPLPYQVALRDHLKRHQPEPWLWFSSQEYYQGDAETARLDLLKTTYRLPRDAHGALYELADRARERLGLTASLTLYQRQQADRRNAFLAYLPGQGPGGAAELNQIHVVFEGPILDLLTPPETLALLGHELAHFVLWESWEHEFFTMRQHIDALAHETLGDPVYDETARLERLYTEIFADRGGLQVCGDLPAMVRALIKVMTGLGDVSAESYLRQADEVFDLGRTGASGWTHPEAYIRARALRLWTEGRDDAEIRIADMLHGPLTLDRLDLLAQQRWRRWTHRLLQVFLSPLWFQTEAVLAHARHFFEDFEPVQGADEALFAELPLEDVGFKDYVCYLMLDFVALAPELEDAPVVAGFELAHRLGLGDRFAKILAKELPISRPEIDRLRQVAARQAADP